jgi:pimeloyl-ACP methyl ester carboxylesterase
VRYTAEQPIFKSWLQFDPAATLAKVPQPVLILQGAADVDLPRTHADALATVARARPKHQPTDTQVVVVAGASHTLTAGSGPVIGLPPLAPDVRTALVAWLHDALGRAK